MSTSSWLPTPLTATAEPRSRSSARRSPGPAVRPTSPAPAVRRVGRLRVLARAAHAMACLGTLWGCGRMLSAWADCYFRLLGEPPAVTTAGVHRFEVGAIVAASAAVTALALAVALRRRGAIVTSLVIAVLAVGTALVFAVPAGRWTPEPQPRPTHDGHYRPCYSGSNDCFGG